MEKCLSKNDICIRNTQGLVFTLASSSSLSVTPLPTPTQFLFASWKSPLSLLGLAGTSNPHPSRQSACQHGCRLCSRRPGLLLEKRQVCLLQSLPRKLNNQWPKTLPAASASIKPPIQSWQLGAGRQVKGNWGRLGVQPGLGAELQASFGLPTWGLGLRGAEGMVGGSPGCDWSSHHGPQRVRE